MDLLKVEEEKKKLECVFPAHVYDGGPEGHGDPSGPAEKTHQVCERTSQQTGGLVYVFSKIQQN